VNAYKDYIVEVIQCINEMTLNKDMRPKYLSEPNILRRGLYLYAYIFGSILSFGDMFHFGLTTTRVKEIQNLEAKTKAEFIFINLDEHQTRRIKNEIKNTLENLTVLLHAKNESIKTSAAFLKENLEGFIDWLDNFEPSKTGIDNPKDINLTYPEIALLFALNYKAITRANGGKIAGEFGQKDGETLYQRYTKVHRRVDRLGFADSSKLKIKHQIERYNKVIPYLDEVHHKNALEEKQKLIELMENQ